MLCVCRVVCGSAASCIRRPVSWKGFVRSWRFCAKFACVHAARSCESVKLRLLHFVVSDREAPASQKKERKVLHRVGSVLMRVVARGMHSPTSLTSNFLLWISQQTSCDLSKTVRRVKFPVGALEIFLRVSHTLGSGFTRGLLLYMYIALCGRV